MTRLAGTAGTCCVRQCSVPRPTTSTRQSIGTTRRPGKQSREDRRTPRRRPGSRTPARARRRSRCRSSRSSPAGAGSSRYSGSGIGSSMTVERAGRRRRSVSSRRRFAASGAWFGSARFGSTTVTTVSRRDEAREVVDVAVGVVALDAVAEPEDLARRRSVSRSTRSMSARVSVRVAVRVQQALLGREQRAFAVDVDRAALEHHARLAKRGTPSASAICRPISRRDRTAGTCRPRRCSRSRRASRGSSAVGRVTKIAPWSRAQASLVGKR